MGSITSTKPNRVNDWEVELFASRAKDGFHWTAWGLFCDALLQRECSVLPRRKDRWAATLASMWNATFNPSHPQYIGPREADQVGVLLWMTISNIVKHGHPMPEHVTPEILTEPVYVERRAEWQEGYARILGIDPRQTTLADLMQGA